MSDHEDFQGFGENFTPEYSYGEQPPVLIHDAKAEVLENLWKAVMGKVFEHHKEQVKRDILEIIKLQK